MHNFETDLEVVLDQAGGGGQVPRTDRPGARAVEATADSDPFGGERELDGVGLRQYDVGRRGNVEASGGVSGAGVNGTCL